MFLNPHTLLNFCSTRLQRNSVLSRMFVILDDFFLRQDDFAWLDELESQLLSKFS